MAVAIASSSSSSSSFSHGVTAALGCAFLPPTCCAGSQKGKGMLGKGVGLRRRRAGGAGEEEEGRRRCGGVRRTVRAAKRVDTGRSLILSSTMVAEEGSEGKVMELCHGIREWAVQKMKDPQAGLKQFECYVDTFDKNVFHFWEQYISFLAMNNFRAGPEHIKFMNDVRPYLKSPIALAAYDYKDGQIGHMRNPIGPKGEGGLDDATGQGGSGGGASYTQHSGAIIQGIEAEPERQRWGLDNMLAKIRNPENEKSDGWSLKTLFGGKK